jgi:Tol biopolymer transport system component
VFAREAVLMGQRVDLERGRTVGEPFPLADHVDYLFTPSRATFSASRTGSIAHHGSDNLSQLVWLDQQGNEVGTVGEPADFEEESTRLSADGTALLTSRRRSDLGTYDIWRRDLVRQTEERLTTDRGVEVTPMFIDDERAVVYSADRAGAVPNVFRKDLVTGVERALHPSTLQQLVIDVIPSKNALIYSERTAQGTFDYFWLSLAAGASPVPLLQSFRDKGEGRVSPDGRVFGFTAADGPSYDLYLTSLPVTRAPILVSRASGPPRWSDDSRRIYFLAGAPQQMMTVDVQTSPSLVVGTPRRLFTPKRPGDLFERSRDGRFLIRVLLSRASQQPISVAVDAVGARRP